MTLETDLEAIRYTREHFRLQGEVLRHLGGRLDQSALPDFRVPGQDIGLRDAYQDCVQIMAGHCTSWAAVLHGVDRALELVADNYRAAEGANAESMRAWEGSLSRISSVLEPGRKASE
jgi:hypothetical protein